MTTKTVQLNRSVTPFEGQPAVTAIVVKEPTGGDFLDIGEPLIWSRTADGAVFSVEDKAAVKAYLNKCIVHEAGAAILRLLTLDDVRAVKAALFSFFDGAEETSAT